MQLDSNGLCSLCIVEGALLNPTCAFCNTPAEFAECTLLPCGDHAHADCAKATQIVGFCPGSCTMRLPCKPLQIASLQFELKQLIMISFLCSSEPKHRLDTEDISDMIAEEMWWILSCIFRNGVGVAKDEKRSGNYFKLALQDGDLDALYHQAFTKRDLLLMQKAAAQGSTKAIRTMANYYMGATIFGKTRPTDMKEAAKYVAKGADTMCVATRAISYYNDVGVGAEADLRKARHYYNTPAIYRKVTLLLASIYRKKKEHPRALTLLEPLPKDEEVWLALGMSHSAVGAYDMAVHAFVSSSTSESYVCLAKLMCAEIINGGEAEIAQLMTLAGDNAEAAFYFLSKGGLEKKEADRFIRMLGGCNDQELLLCFMKEFRARNQMNYFKLCKSLFEALRKK